MIKNLLLFLTVALLISSAGAGELTNRLQFPVAGFTITPLEAPPGDSAQQALVMYLPTTDGFAPSVNVQIQPYTGTIEDYVKLSLQQFKSAKFKILQQKAPAKAAALFEYTGEIQGRTLHWYSRAEKSGNSVYLVTATATTSQWIKEAAQLKSCVDGFRCESSPRSIVPVP